MTLFAGVSYTFGGDEPRKKSGTKKSHFHASQEPRNDVNFNVGAYSVKGNGGGKKGGFTPYGGISIKF